MDVGDNDNGGSKQNNEVGVHHIEGDEFWAHEGNDANINNANMNNVFVLDYADNEDLIGRWGHLLLL